MCRPKTIKLAVAALLVYGFTVVISGYADSREETKAVEPPTLTRILVMPFQNMTLIHGNNHTVRGPLTRKVFVTGEVAPKAELVMDAALQELLSHRTGTQWPTPNADDRVLLMEGIQGAELIKAIQVMGQRNRADAVMVGYLYAYRDRIGGAYGAEAPAGIAFELALVHVQNGGILWRRGFSEIQQPLNENLLEIGKFIRRKGRFLSAREMGRQAMKQMLQSFPSLQNQPLNKSVGVE